MKSIRFLKYLCLLSLLFSSPAVWGAQMPVHASPAFEKYLKRPRTELSKLVYLMDRFNGTESVVIFEGRHYPYKEAVKRAKAYLAENYKNNAAAEAWIHEHCYRSRFSNELIQVKHPDGQVELLRDILLQELEILNQALHAKPA